MASKNQIAERIAYALGDPINFVLKENIKFSLTGWRALLIRRDSAANGISDEFLQRIYFPLQAVDKADACEFDVDCTVLRTVDKVPKPVRMKNDVLFKAVGIVDGNKSFDYTEYEEIRFRCANKFTGREPIYAYINGYIYVINYSRIKRLYTQYTPVRPEDVVNCDTGLCYSDDDEYPLADDMIPDIIRGILSGEFKVESPEQAVNIEQQPEK